MKDTASFLLKVLVLSAALSLVLKWIGPTLPIASLEGDELNHVAIALVTLPSFIIGTILLAKSRTS